MENYDVCIFGAGPSGAVIAKKLAQFGYKVVMIEKEKLLGNNLGLSLTPGIHHWLDLLGIDEEIKKAGFSRALQSNVLWEDDTITKKTFDPNLTGYHVNKGEFDEILLKSALGDGVLLLRPCILNRLDQDEKGNWSISLTHGHTKKIFSAKFIVEATGRKSIQKGTKKAYLPKTMATYAYWKSSLTNQLSFIEAGENEWFWGVPLKDGYLSCVFSDPKVIKQYSSVQDFFYDKMNHSTLFSSLQCESTVSLMACPATAYQDISPVTDNYIKVGDAAFTMDPLSSQGVQKAIKSAYQGAIVVNTLLKKKNASSAMDYYKTLIETEVRKNTLWTRQFYNTQKRFVEGEFWNLRKDCSINSEKEINNVNLSIRKEDKLFINPNAIFTSVPVVGECVIENHEGLKLEGNIEPFVFVQNTSVTSLVRQMNGKSLLEGLRILQITMPQSNPMKILQWLIYHRILSSKELLISH